MSDFEDQLAAEALEGAFARVVACPFEFHRRTTYPQTWQDWLWALELDFRDSWAEKLVSVVQDISGRGFYVE